MDINNIGARVSKFGGKVKDSASKTKENWKIDSQIKEVQNELNDAYRILGFTFYEKTKENGVSMDDDHVSQYKGLFDDIDEKSGKLAALMEEKGAIAQKHCGQCGKSIPGNSRFCPHCGAEYGE